MKGYLPCRKCAICCLNKIRYRRVCNFQSLVTSKSYDMKSFITCAFVNVVYLIICPCGLQYMGHTVRARHLRIKEHIANIRQGFPGHIVSKHYLQCHNKNPAGLMFLAIDKFTPFWRGSFLRW